MRTQRSVIAISVLALAASLGVSAPAAAQNATQDTTALTFSTSVTRQLLTMGIGVIARAPATMRLAVPRGRFQVRLPITKYVNSPTYQRLVNDGAIIFSTGNGARYHTVVLNNLRLDLSKGAYLADVILGEGTASDSGTGRPYKTIRVFDISMTTPSGPCSFNYSLTVTNALAYIADKTLGDFIAPGTRMGTGTSDCDL
jgi:hypothetical protein